MSDHLPPGWTEEADVLCVVCPDCAFTFDASHTDTTGGYSCPCCSELRREAVVQRLGTAVDLIAAERRRQVAAEGWTPEHDDEHVNGELACAADSYIFAALAKEASEPMVLSMLWPWERSWWKPSDDPVRNLVKAGALIAAEIDRLKRASGVSS